MKAGFVVSPIIRGYTLHFVGYSPGNRYSEVASWPFAAGGSAEKPSSFAPRCEGCCREYHRTGCLAGLLRTETAQAVQAWDDATVLNFVSERHRSA